MLSFEFMWWAFAAALLVGLTAPAVGFFLVERRMSLIGDAVGHLAFAGVTLGFLLDLDPVITALAVTVTGAVSLEWLRSRARAAGDQALAILLYTGMAAGVVLAGAAHATNANLLGFLFGSILTVSSAEVARMAVLAALVLATVALLYRRFLAVALDEEGARATGLPVDGLNALLAGLAAITIGVAMRAVGLLLVAALMVLPVASAGLFSWSVRSTLLLAMALGAASAVVGLIASWNLNLAPGGSIVLVAAATYLVGAVSQALRNRRRHRF